MIDIHGYGNRLAAAIRGVVADDLVGVYVHGSVALGGFRPDRSDVDVLAVVAQTLSPNQQATAGEALLAAAFPCPGTGLEASVITASTAADLGDCRFEVHVATPDTVTIGADHPDDPDLVLYAEVCRRSGITVTGPAAATTFAAVPHDQLVATIRAELEWGLASAPFEYAVLNACRAMLFARDGSLVSKIAGGESYLREHSDDAVIAAALARQRGSDAQDPPRDAVAAFVRQAQEMLGATRASQSEAPIHSQSPIHNV
ncbi:MAG TPA: aminoglycoside adenylyltransferase domain-containing protein [Micromonosporaceae bacterium]|nr:aminoglycoside adenylyltransferase domain-containing protein [Micromonosporaceae bacterium]